MLSLEPQSEFYWNFTSNRKSSYADLAKFEIAIENYTNSIEDKVLYKIIETNFECPTAILIHIVAWWLYFWIEYNENRL